MAILICDKCGKSTGMHGSWDTPLRILCEECGTANIELRGCGKSTCAVSGCVILDFDKECNANVENTGNTGNHTVETRTSA